MSEMKFTCQKAQATFLFEDDRANTTIPNGVTIPQNKQKSQRRRAKESHNPKIGICWSL